jgi:ethanolamine utilization protein EutN
MRVAKVIGTMTLNRSHPSLAAASFRIAVPLSLADLTGRSRPSAEPLVVVDELGAGLDCLLAVSEGSEAAQPYYPELKPVDAYNAAILDSVDTRNAP